MLPPDAAARIKSALAEVHIVEVQYDRERAAEWVKASHRLSAEEYAILRRALNLPAVSYQIAENETYSGWVQDIA